MAEYQIARVAADPAPVPEAAEPGGWPGLVYYRLHGSPHMYSSIYPATYLHALAERLAATSRLAPTWCIFDNTVGGAATENALTMLEALRTGKPLAIADGLTTGQAAGTIQLDHTNLQKGKENDYGP